MNESGSRDDFIIAIRSAFLKKGNQQRFSLIGLIIFSIILLVLGSFNYKPINYLKSGIKEILFIGDPFCEFGKKTNLTLDLTAIGLGLRLSRFALIIDNCIIKDLLDEEGGALDKSAAESVLNAL